MTPELERFLDLATRPLEANPGPRDEAKGELMARVGHAGVPFEMLDLAEPLARLEAAPPEKPWRRRGALLAALVLSAGAVLGITAFLAYQITLSTMVSFLSYQRFAHYNPSASFENTLLLRHVERTAPGLPLGREILAGGDGMAETEHALSRQPDDPAMLQEHVCRQIFKAGKEWTGFDEETKAGIARLDGDNALWPLLQAFALMESCADPMARYGSSGTPAIKDEAAFQFALRSFSEAATKSSYCDRSWVLIRRQIEAFPPTRSFYDEVVVQGFTGFVTRPFRAHYHYRGDRLGLLARARCERLVTAKDPDGLRAFLGEWRNVVQRVLESPEPVELDSVTILIELNAMGDNLANACKDLGMVADESATRTLLKRLHVPGYGGNPMPPELRTTAGVRLETYNRGTDGLTVEEVLPSRKTELAFFDRHVAISLALAGLVFSGLVGLEACRRSKNVKGTARGLIPLFRREDHFWIGGLGLALPWLWWWVITRMTPLGLHRADPNEVEEGMMALMIQPAAAMILAMVLLLQTTRRRWELRGGFLALGGFFPRVGWVAAALTALAIPAAGGILYFPHWNGDDKALYLLGASCMAAIGLLWLLWEGIMNLFTPRASALRPNLVMRALLPWTFAGLFTLLAAYGVSTFMERRWFAKDPLLPSWTSKTHRNAFEERRAEKWLDP